MRFDLYSGPFTRDDQFTVSPFVDSFFYLPDVPLSLATATVDALNNAGANERRSEEGGLVGQYYDAVEKYTKGDVEKIFRGWLQKMNNMGGIEKRAMANLTLGYVTQDVRLFHILMFLQQLTCFYRLAQVLVMIPRTRPFPSSSLRISSRPTRRLAFRTTR